MIVHFAESSLEHKTACNRFALGDADQRLLETDANWEQVTCRQCLKRRPKEPR